MSRSRRRSLMQIDGDIPSGYTIVKYLEANGKQSIETNILPVCNNLYFEIKFMIARLTSNAMLLFGVKSENVQVTSFQAPVIGGKLRADMCAGYNKFYNTSLNINQEYIFKILNDNCIFEDNSFVIRKVTYTKNLCLFNSDITRRDSAWIGKIFYLHMVSSDVDYNIVPAVDLSGIPCMLNLNTGYAFYNSGEGQFGYEKLDGTYVAPI